MYNRAMRRNTVRSLSHVRDFVASAFFEKEKGGAVRRDETEGPRFPQNARSVQNIIYLSSLIGRRSADWRPVTRATCADQRMRATNVLLFKRDGVSL